MRRVSERAIQNSRRSMRDLPLLNETGKCTTTAVCEVPNRTPSPRYLDACDDNDNGMSFQIELRRRAIIQPRHHGRLIFFSFTTNCDNKKVEPA